MAKSILEDLSEQTFTDSTIRRMFSLVDRAKTDAEFQKLIYGLVNRAMPGQWKNYKGELSTVFNWFKKNVDYRRDPYGVELLQDVWATLDRKRGDCDDATIFMAAAAEILGSPARIVTVSTRPSQEPNHVYAEAFVGGRWQGLDATVSHSYVGWTPPQVTARKIWTRKELGLSTSDDLEGIEGLGMSDDIYATEFYGTMTPVSGRLAPGVRDDISKTDAPGIPGVTNISERRIWRAPVANNSEWTSDPRPGGGVYGPALPVAKRPLPQDLWYLVDRVLVPKVLDPDDAWWGAVPTAREDFDRMLPGANEREKQYLREIASVPASAIAGAARSIRASLDAGRIAPEDVPAAIENELKAYASKNTNERGLDMVHTLPMPTDRRYLVQAPSKSLTRVRGGGLNGLGGMGSLGDTIDDAAKLLSAQIASGQVPSSPSAINSAINAVVGVITGKPAGTPVTAASVLPTAIPIGMVALVGFAAWLISRGGSKKSYRRNPSRRRSRGGRRGGGGGIDMKKIALWGGGGLAAYFLLLRPGAPLMPVLAPKPLIPGMTPQQQAALAAGVKAAPGIFDSISKLFSSSSSSASTPSGSQFVTSYDQLTPSQAEPASQFQTTFYS